jgi:hypothetical protein
MGVVKDAFVRLFSCFSILAKKDCLCHSKCCCGDCETDIIEHDAPSPATSPVKKRKLPHLPTLGENIKTK